MNYDLVKFEITHLLGTKNQNQDQKGLKIVMYITKRTVQA